MWLAARGAVNKVNERAWYVAGAVTAAALVVVVVPTRPSASTGTSRKNSLMM
jgi:hypothetical protein